MKVLIIGPYAPHGQVGAIRMISLSRYLIEKGHTVTVLCLSEKVLKEMDPKGLSAAVPDGVKIIPYDVMHTCNSIMKKNMINQKECCGALVSLLEKQEFDVALISGGPFYQFKASSLLKQKGIPFIVDYRDLHISSPEKRKRKGLLNKIKFGISYPVRFFQEYNCIRRANVITVVAPEMRENISTYFHISKEKIQVAYNGFDDAVLRNIDIKKSDNQVLTIGYFGKLMYYNRDLTAMLFEAIDKINNDGLKVKLLHIGPANDSVYEFFELHQIKGNQWYKCLGQKEYRKGIELLSTCDAYALEYAYPEGPGTKVFDYIFLNKPIIGVLKPGISLEKLLAKFDNAFICHSVEEINTALQTLLAGDVKVLIDSQDSQSVIYDYSRSKQNKHFEELMENISLRRKYYDDK